MYVYIYVCTYTYIIYITYVHVRVGKGLNITYMNEELQVLYIDNFLSIDNFWPTNVS